MRDHNPVVIEEFNGLWQRGDYDSVPLDHFARCNNIQFIQSGFENRDGFDPYLPYANVVRVYTFSQETGESLLVLDSSGNIFDSGSPSPNTPILTIATMTDFSFTPYAGRAYITPHNGVKGLQNEYVYVYKGDGTPARLAAGQKPTNSNLPLTIRNSDIPGTGGAIQEGYHVLAIFFENAAGDRSMLGPITAAGDLAFAILNSPGGVQAYLSNIPIGPAGTTKRGIVSTKTFPKNFSVYSPDFSLLTYYLAATINDNVTTAITGGILDQNLTTDLTGLLTAPTGSNPPSRPLTNAFVAVNDVQGGHQTKGIKLFGIVYETDTGFLTAPGPENFAPIEATWEEAFIRLINIPTSLDPSVVKRHIVATKVIPDWNGDQNGFQFFFVPNGDIPDNVQTVFSVSFFDSELLEDASHLIDNFDKIPAGVGINTYHGRLITWAEYDNISVIRVSDLGEPESINQVDGIIIVPLDGKPLTYCQEFRDVLYACKETRTVAYNDNNDVPSSWPLTILDQGIGASVHGIAAVLDSGGVNVDFLIIVDFSGIMLFNGSYSRPELTWKIRDLWLDIDRSLFKLIQILNDSISQILFIVLPGGTMLIGDYSNGLNPKDIRWSPWSSEAYITTATLIDGNTLIVGADVLP